MNRAVLGVVLFLAAYYDYRKNRIPNWLCAFGMAAGMFGALYSLGLKDGALHLLWAAGLFFCFFPLWCLRVIGGGDVKLAMTAALFLGRNCIPFFVSAGVCLGIHAIVLMIGRKNYLRRMTIFVQYMMECLNQRKIKPYPFDLGKDYKDGGIRVSYGFLAGHLMAVLLGMYQ